MAGTEHSVGELLTDTLGLVANRTKFVAESASSDVGWLTDLDGNHLQPKTCSTAVTCADGQCVEDALDDLKDADDKINHDMLIIAGKATFKAEAYAEAQDNDLDILVVESFDDVSGLDLTDTNTKYVVDNYYDADEMHLDYTGSGPAVLKAANVTLDDEPRYFWIRVGYTGTGTVQIDINMVGAKVFTDWPNCECRYLVVGQRSKTIGATLTLNGHVTLNNIAWGVR